MTSTVLFGRKMPVKSSCMNKETKLTISKGNIFFTPVNLNNSQLYFDLELYIHTFKKLINIYVKIGTSTNLLVIITIAIKRVKQYKVFVTLNKKIRTQNYKNWFH